MLFPEANDIEGHPTVPMPMFLSGEKRQAVLTSAFIPPVKKVVKVGGEINQVQLKNYLYVTSKSYNPMKLTLSRSKCSIGLSGDLDDDAVSLLINNGLKTRFPTVCGAWELHKSESKEVTQKSILEKKKQVDEDLKNNQPLLEDTLAWEITRKISDAYPYVLPTQFY